MPRPAVTIRLATVADAATVAALGAVTFHEAYQAKARQQDLDAYIAQQYTPARLFAALGLPEVTLWLAESELEAVGFLELQRTAAPPEVGGKKPLKLNRLYLRQQFWGRGLGTELMAYAVAAGRRDGHDVLWLSVWDQNPAAVRFYQRWGFRTVGSEVFVVGEDRSTDLLMACPLAPLPPGDDISFARNIP